MTQWLRVRLDSGMFSDEVAVTYPASATTDWQKSVFVPSACVRQDSENQGKVKVMVVVKDGQKFAVLPSSRRDIVTPEEADLSQQ
jgi:hypothetical protein